MEYWPIDLALAFGKLLDEPGQGWSGFNYIQEEKMTTQQQKETLVAYLRMKTDEQDWHGVADAAMDLRELEIKLQMESKLAYSKQSNIQQAEPLATPTIYWTRSNFE
jgi:hypothetical protein